MAVTAKAAGSAAGPAAAPASMGPLAPALATWVRRVLEGAATPALGDAQTADESWGGWWAPDLPVSFVYGGQPSGELLARWTRTTALSPTPDGRTVHTLTLRDPVTDLEVTWQATTYADHPALTWLVTFTNQGHQDTPQLETVRALDLRLATDCYDLVLHYATGGHATPDAFQPHEHCLRSEPGGPFRLGSLGGRSSNGVLPYFNVETNWQGIGGSASGDANSGTGGTGGTGDGSAKAGANGVVVGIGWSGQWETLFMRERSAPPNDREPDLRGPNGQVSALRSLDRLHVQGGMEGVHLVLHPGESIRTPRILLVPWEGDRRHGQNALRRFLHQRIAPAEQGQAPLPALWCSLGIADPSGATLAAGFTHEGLAATGAQLPVDYVVLDAGWYESPSWAQGVGNYTVRRDIFPHGLRPLADIAHRAGKGFGLWFEPERVYEGTEVFRDHPGWLFPATIGERGQSYVFNMGNPAAREWLTDTVSRMIRAIGIEWYRHDANANYLPVWRAADAPDRQGISEIRHIEGLYAFWQALLDRHPGLYIEGCSSGGRRMDFEALHYHHSYFYTDWMVGDPAGMQSNLHGASEWLPGNYMNCVMGHPAAAVEDTVERRYAFWSATGGGMMYGWRVFNDGKDMDMDLARRWIGAFRALRHLAVGDFYPLLPHTNSEAAWVAAQYDRPDLGEGLLVAFRRRHCAEDTVLVRPRGLAPEASYVLTFQSAQKEVVRTGRELAAGVWLTLTHAPQHELIHYCRR